MKPAEHVLDEELGFAVGVGGREGRGLFDGSGGGFAVDGGSGGEDELVDAGGEHGFEEREGGGGVVAEVELGLLHGLAGFDERGEVEDAIGAEFAEEGLDAGTVGDVGFDERCASGEVGTLAVAEVIEDGDLVAGLHEDGSDGSADVAGASGYEDVHWGSLFEMAMAVRNVLAADSGVMSRWGEPRSSKPTMNLRTVAERRSGG